ncbi:ADP,ATP carrier protein 1 [Musa troglodytarum]|uniref:ADP,ATP carrier protein 1 n=1 Tax=Musa troglodytarum TaxID=320322 RepID=A0A9E7GXS0_9LILI|nr:ADP,ATP carrier protein 1 [Musa troglodytarum]
MGFAADPHMSEENFVSLRSREEYAGLIICKHMSTSRPPPWHTSLSSSSPSRLGFRFAFSRFVLVYVVVLDRAFLPAADRTVMDGFELDAPRQYFATSSLVVGYALCSSLLSVINKFAITMFDYPGLLTALQYLTSTVGVWVLGKLGFLYHDPFTFETAKKFLPAATVFYLAIFTNTNLLRHANVDTFVVFRSLTPLLVAIADTIFRKQPCPSKLTFFSLVVILGGAVCYVLTDSAFNLTAYSWAIAYLVTITTEMVYIKHMVTNLGLNTWGFVFYNNLLSLMMAPAFCFVTGEYADVFTAYGSSSGIWFNIMAFVAVALSCVFGFLISFFGFAARKAISATAFTVTGVANKFLTVAINVLIWDKHASKIGLICLLLTLVGGVLYQQSVTSDGHFSQQRGSTISKKANGVVGNVDSEDERHDKRLSGRDSVHERTCPALHNLACGQHKEHQHHSFESHHTSNSDGFMVEQEPPKRCVAPKIVVLLLGHWKQNE